MGATRSPYPSPEVPLRAACRLVAAHYHGAAGRFAYDAFDWINAALFAETLPEPLIVWALTPHGGCLASTRAGDAPVITLHPSLLGGSERRNPWQIPADLLGPAFALDALLHECIHVALGTAPDAIDGPAIHNAPGWIAEVNRLAPLLGLAGFQAGRSTTRRVPITGAPAGPRGRPPTRVERVSEATFHGRPLPFAAVAGFPTGTRRLLDQTAVYRDGALPFPHALGPRTGGVAHA